MEDDKTFDIVESYVHQPKFSLEKKRDGFTRQDVVNAVAKTFEMIGGVNRMVLWADRNEDKFYAIYSKLLPSTAISIGEAKHVHIEHSIAPTALDRHPDV
jgi:hypothetical protein